MSERKIQRQTGQFAMVIPNGTALTPGVNIGEFSQLVILTAAAWTAAVLTFQGSADGVTWFDVYGDDATEVSIPSATLGTSRALVDVAILRKLFGLTWIRLRSGTSGAPVNQGAARTITLVVKS